jgi:hypothetical protein
MADKLARTIPVLGQIYEAGQSIREIMTGEKFQIDEQNRRSGMIDAASGAAKAARERGDRDNASAGDRIRDIRRGNALFGVNAEGAAAVRQSQTAQDAIDAANAAADARAKAIADTLSPQRRKLESELSGIAIPKAVMEYSSAGVGAMGQSTGRISNADAISQAQSERARVQTQLEMLRRQEADQLAESNRLREQELEALKEKARLEQVSGGAAQVGGMLRSAMGTARMAALRLRGIDLWSNPGEPANAPTTEERQAARDAEWSSRSGLVKTPALIPFAPGGESLARVAAMERAQFGMSEADRKTISLLESIDRKLAEQDDTYR